MWTVEAKVWAFWSNLLPCGTLSLRSLRILSGFGMQLLFRSEWRVLSQTSCHIDDHAGHEEHQHWGAPRRKPTRVKPSQLEELDELKAGCPRPLANDPIQWPVQRKPRWLCLTRLWDRHRMFCYLQPASNHPVIKHCVIYVCEWYIVMYPMLFSPRLLYWNHERQRCNRFEQEDLLATSSGWKGHLTTSLEIRCGQWTKQWIQWIQSFSSFVRIPNRLRKNAM